MPTNDQKVGQLADIANKEFGRLSARLRRIGHDKPGKQMAAMDVSGLDHTTRLLWHNWRKAEKELESEAGSPSQAEIDFDKLDTPAPAEDNRIDLFTRLLGETEKVEVAADRFTELKENNAHSVLLATGGGKKAKTFQIGEKFVVVSDVLGGGGMREVVIASVAVDAKDWEGISHEHLIIEDPDSTEPVSFKGLKVQGNSRRRFVLTGERLAIILGDPLAASMDAAIDTPAVTEPPSASIPAIGEAAEGYAEAVAALEEGEAFGDEAPAAGNPDAVRSIVEQLGEGGTASQEDPNEDAA